MSALDVKVEIGLDLHQDAPSSFKLDDAVRGVLDNVDYTLGGALFYDITNRVRSISTKRGKNQALDKIDAGLSSITFDNSDRYFDPLYPSSPFFDFLVPRREVVVTSNGYPVFYGYIDDLDYNYLPGNIATVTVDISDGFSVLANSELPEIVTTQQLPGPRIEAVLNQPTVNWPAENRNIDAGVNVLIDNIIPEGTNTLEYLQLVAQSEFGDLFIDRAGWLTFRGKTAVSTLKNVAFTDDLTPTSEVKVPYMVLDTVYGSENLYNRIILSNADAIPDVVTLEDAQSGVLFGIRTYSASGLLTLNPADLTSVAQSLLDHYKNPQYRFESITVNLDQLDLTDLSAVLDLEIGDYVSVAFTPSNIPPEIAYSTRIIGIKHDWTPANKRVTYSLETLIYGIFVLDNASLGILDTNTLS